MKKIIFTSILALLVTAGIIKAQDRPDEYLGLPGDNLNLYAVMNLFQESQTLEEFERNLNEPDSRINNLDLNGDNLVDYIMVSDYVDRNVHTIVLQVALNQNEKQDVAVFTVERLRNGSVQIQLIGDEYLYGRNYIIEPLDNDKPNPGYRGRSGNNITFVASWPLVRYIYQPNYVIWRSSWYWGYYPSYWRPWNPFYYDYYYGYHRNFYPVYYQHYRHWDRPRYNRYNDFYYSRHRVYSPQVRTRISEGRYKATYSRPEQRRDGEALYNRTHADNNRRTVNQTTTRDRNTYNGTNGGERRSTSVNRNQSRTGTYDQTGTSRRSTTVINNNSGNSGRTTTVNRNTRTSPSTGTSTTRRSTTTVTNRNQPAERSSGTTTRTTTTVNRNNSVSAPSSRRSTETVSNRTVSRPQSASRSEASRSSRSAGRSTTSAGRSERASKSVSVKRSEKSSSSSDDNSNSSRRK